MDGHVRQRRRCGHRDIALQVAHELTRPRRKQQIPIAHERQRRIGPSGVRDTPLSFDIVNDDRVDAIERDRGLSDRSRATVEVGVERDRDLTVGLSLRHDTVRAGSERTRPPGADAPAASRLEPARLAAPQDQQVHDLVVTLTMATECRNRRGRHDVGLAARALARLLRNRLRERLPRDYGGSHSDLRDDRDSHDRQQPDHETQAQPHDGSLRRSAISGLRFAAAPAPETPCGTDANGLVRIPRAALSDKPSRIQSNSRDR